MLGGYKAFHEGGTDAFFFGPFASTTQLAEHGIEPEPGTM
jgi:hypothetical protein